MSFNGQLGLGLLGDFELAFVGSDLEQSVESIITFVSTASAGSEFNAEVESIISFVSTASAAGIANNTIVFTQDATNNIRQESVTSTLVFVSTAVGTNPNKRVLVSQFMQLDQTATSHIGVRHVGVGNFLSLTQKLNRIISASASSTIAFVSTGVRKNIGISTLSFVSSASGAKGGNPSSLIAFTHEVVVNGTYNRDAVNAIIFNQAVAYHIVGACTKKDYSLFVGSATDPLYPIPSDTAPTLGTATFTLTYPYVTPTTTLLLRNPDFGNRDRLNFNRINRASRGGTLMVYADPIWPKMQSLQVTIPWLKSDQLGDLKTFLLDSIGKEIGLLDNENRQWRGFVTNPDLDLSHVGKHNRQVIIEFEGELV